MKKIIIVAALCLGLTTACSDFLSEQNPNSVPSATYFTTEQDVQRAVYGIYQSMRSGSALGEGSTLYAEERADNTGRNDNQSAAGEPFQFNDFSLLPTNSYLKSHWAALYQIVSRANFVLTYIDGVPFAVATDREAYRAEALFGRALAYFHLVRKWGDVPMVTRYVENYQTILEATTRVAKEQVYNQIVADLTQALTATSLPDLQPVGGKGRTCKAAINALLGQVYLTMGCTLADQKQTRWTAAKKHLEAAYAVRTFGTLSEIPYADVFDVAKKTTCKELVFQIVYQQGDPTYSSSIARNNQSEGETINSQYSSKGQGTFVKPDLANDYEAGDLRKDFSVRYAKHANAKAWFITKFRDASTAAGKNGYGGNDWVLIRYADIILMLAEVNNYLGNETEAIGYLDQVRTRAGLPSYAVAWADPTYRSKYPTLKLAILHERRVELAFENHRLFDLLRSFTPEEFAAYFHAKNQDDYGLSNLKNCGVKDIYYPIPFDEWKLNPEKMAQNPGY